MQRMARTGSGTRNMKRTTSTGASDMATFVLLFIGTLQRVSSDKACRMRAEAHATTVDGSSFLVPEAAGGKEAVGKQEVPGFVWSYIWVDPEGNMIGLFEPARRRQARRTARASKKARRR